MHKRNSNMQAYFNGLVEACAQNLEQHGSDWPFPGLEQEARIVSLYFEKQANGYFHWLNGVYMPITDALFNYVRGYAAKRGVPIFIEP